MDSDLVLFNFTLKAIKIIFITNRRLQMSINELLVYIFVETNDANLNALLFYSLLFFPFMIILIVRYEDYKYTISSDLVELMNV